MTWGILCKIIVDSKHDTHKTLRIVVSHITSVYRFVMHDQIGDELNSNFSRVEMEIYENMSMGLWSSMRCFYVQITLVMMASNRYKEQTMPIIPKAYMHIHFISYHNTCQSDSLASHFECIGQYTQKWMCEENVCMELRTNKQQWMTMMFSKWAVRWWRITENPHIVKQLITFIVWCTEQLRWRPICTMQILLSNKGVYWDSQHGVIIPSVRFSSNTSPCWSYWQ